jgi:single-strand DNA-binding protein
VNTFLWDLTKFLIFLEKSIMLNITAAGNVGNDAQLRKINGSNGEVAVLNFSLATKSKKKGQDGKPLTIWLECSLWGKRAEALAQYLKKGTVVSVTGEPGVDSYEGQNGLVLKQTVNVEDIHLLGGKTQTQAQPMGQTQAQPGFTPAPTSFNDEQMPF